MSQETLENRIRRRAYELWLADGSMEGCADEYWRRARLEVEAEVAEEARQAPPRAAGSGPAIQNFPHDTPDNLSESDQLK
ncbi:DUF2934 domain-containing protein (plasmid) [Paraburkholderia sp. D15]|uniref:DUF2934 domain-containing protein n=1 Tax=Paraburkholderia sp. D15 TaxID=2880218 RepID=UPI00247A286C|nr:DUF2934 domain-containing protein [Paraburkholderia sp. D15]WGS54967.1 DUF2934 domain-containing protein [Paraburkholderia sp. D15]